jgi:hypothetical protein
LLSDYNYHTSNIELPWSDSFRTDIDLSDKKRTIFACLYWLFHELFTDLTSFSQISAESRNSLGCGFHTVSGIFGFLLIWHPASGIWHQVSMLHVVGLSTVADFPIDSGGPAAVTPYVNGIPAVVRLPAGCCWLHYFFKRPCFC